MIRDKAVDTITPTPERVLELIVSAERHRKFVWTAGRLLKEATLWRRVEELDYDERKLVVRRVADILEGLASQGILQRRHELQSIGYGSEIGFDYVRSND
jgi:hypothetical protein